MNMDVYYRLIVFIVCIIDGYWLYSSYSLEYIDYQKVYSLSFQYYLLFTTINHYDHRSLIIGSNRCIPEMPTWHLAWAWALRPQKHHVSVSTPGLGRIHTQSIVKGMCIRLYVYIYTYTYMYIYILRDMHIHTYIYIYIRIL